MRSIKGPTTKILGYKKGVTNPLKWIYPNHAEERLIDRFVDVGWLKLFSVSKGLINLLGGDEGAKGQAEDRRRLRVKHVSKANIISNHGSNSAKDTTSTSLPVMYGWCQKVD